MEVVLSSGTEAAQHGDLMRSWARSHVQANLWRHHGRDAEGKLPTRQVRVNQGHGLQIAFWKKKVSLECQGWLEAHRTPRMTRRFTSR